MTDRNPDYFYLWPADSHQRGGSAENKVLTIPMVDPPYMKTEDQGKQVSGFSTIASEAIFRLKFDITSLLNSFPKDCGKIEVFRVLTSECAN